MDIVLKNKNLDLMSLDKFNVDTVEYVAKSVGFWGVILGAIVAFVKKIVIPVWKFFKEYHDHKALLIKGNENIDAILKELRPNGGSSLKDQISRIENNIELLDIKVASVALATNVGYWKSDSRGHVVEVGRSLCIILGRTESEIIGNNWINIVHPEDRDRVKEEWDSSVADSRNFELVYRMVKSDGSIQKVKGVAYAIVKNYNLIGYFGTLIKEGEPYFENK